MIITPSPFTPLTRSISSFVSTALSINTLVFLTALPVRLVFFTKLLKPVYATLHSMGHLNSGYIDDSYLQGDTVEDCQQNVGDTVTLFTRLGFFIHPEKLVFVPTQRLTF
ncbi:unnamed protein product, partial [Porites lobata]